MSNFSPTDAIVLGGIDQYLPHRAMEKNILTSIHDRTLRAIEDKNLSELENIARALLGVAQVSGIAFSEYVYTLEACWSQLGQKIGFYQWAEDKLGRDEKTLERHQRVWEMLISGDIPKTQVEKFKTMPIRVLIPIGTLWKRGKYEITEENWRELSNAPDPTTVGKIIRKIKGKEATRKGALNIEWYRSNKTIMVWKDGKKSEIYLMYDENDENAVAALDRLFGDGRALEK